jgi:hypothetical protein
VSVEIFAKPFDYVMLVKPCERRLQKDLGGRWSVTNLKIFHLDGTHN